MVRSVFALSLFLLLSVEAVAVPGENPSAPTNTIATWSPLFGNSRTVRCAWSPPRKWNDDNNVAARYYIARCYTARGELVYQQSIPVTQYLVQFDVPYLSTKYTFQVVAVNSFNKVSQPGKYSVWVP